MNSAIRITPEVQFCLQYLRDNNIGDGKAFDECLKKSKPSRVFYRIVPAPDDDFFTNLASQMRELWPMGKKDGKWDWREPVDNLAGRLKWLWGMRNLEKYSVEDCLLVSRQYISAHRDNAKYMKLLKYFILRQRDNEFVGDDGRIHHTYDSEFANMLENLTDEERQREKDATAVEELSLDSGGVLI